ncbi:DUF4241 domain-containing protein [Kribbella antibiotica]|uniref:DUF4241 domain-containing protein n=1 Tax=Kribbella antibiotica TaxID=190195 RepID=UPI0014046B42|nr:DUF4241 domain-containing protein [Kribbella antibiotica]
MTGYDFPFRAGDRYSWSSGSHSETEIISAGVVHFLTGAVVAADPAWSINPLEESDAVAANVPPGSYPVSLLVSVWQQTPASGVVPRSKVCVAKLHVSNDPVTQWVPAFPSGSDDGAILGFAVDSGTASFFDFSAKDWLTARQAADDWYDEISDLLLRDHYVLVEDQATGFNAIVYECGMGDGVYEVWLGLNSDRQVAEILVDLELLSHSTGADRGHG